MRPERDHLEIRFPRVDGYRVELPEERLTAQFNDDSLLELTPELVGATTTRTPGSSARASISRSKHIGDVRPSQVVYELTSAPRSYEMADADGDPQLHLFGQLKRIARQWLDDYLVCKGGTYPGTADVQDAGRHGLRAHHCRHHPRLHRRAASQGLLDPYNPVGSTTHVNFNTSKTDRWETDARRCHINWVVLDSDWEARVLPGGGEHIPASAPTSRTTTSGSRFPTAMARRAARTCPTSSSSSTTGTARTICLHLVVEIKGYRGEDAKEKKSTMETYWVPAVNHSASMDDGHSRNSPTSIRSSPTSRRRSRARSTNDR